MISIIITTYKEKLTLPKAIQSIVKQNIPIDYELLVVSPDKETQETVNEFVQEYPQIKFLQDKGIGKPAALNLAFKKTQGEIIVLTDGDVQISDKSVGYLLKPFNDLKVGAVTGQPISVNSRRQIFGYWSHFLTNAAHQMRLKNKKFPCSGYLYAIRRELIQQIPEDVFSEDAVITEIIRRQGYKIIYVPEALVYVKYPDNFKDWILQKIRAVGGNIQKQSGRERNLWQEITNGLNLFFSYPKNVEEFWWIILLSLARLYLWFLIFWQIKIKKKGFADIWQRVESTK